MTTATKEINMTTILDERSAALRERVHQHVDEIFAQEGDFNVMVLRVNPEIDRDSLRMMTAALEEELRDNAQFVVVGFADDTVRRFMGRLRKEGLTLRKFIASYANGDIA